MIEKALNGSKTYWSWIGFLLVLMMIGGYYWVRQFTEGLGITGLSRDVTWGLYIAQLTFLVGVAASAVMVVLPYYLHNFKAFGKMTILGEFVAVGAVVMCILFVFVDLGQPFRIMNVVLYASPHSILFWDTVVLSIYMLLNLLISWVSIGAEKKGIHYPKWLKPFIYISIPWAFSIHTVTAFLYAGLASRPFWMTAILAPRFLASAFAAGPALLILIALFLRKNTKFDAGEEAIEKLSVIVTYALGISIFFVLMELFTAFYSAMPEHMSHFIFMFKGLEGNTFLVPWMWVSSFLTLSAFILMLIPKMRRNHKVLIFACVATFVGLWIEKGLGLIITGFIPNPLGEVVDYVPTLPESMIAIAIYALGALIITVLYRMALGVRGQLK